MDTLQTDTYTIHFGTTSLAALKACVEAADYSGIFILTDTNTARDCYPVLCRELPEASTWKHITIPAGEAHKTIATCTNVWESLSSKGADRQSLVVNLGGGVVTDLGGFVASTYQRGVDFINIPTTLLAMVDASVGGKTGVDLGNLKNQVGLIQQPEMVLINPAYLKTLEPREILSGYSEMLKHGLIWDRDYWDLLKNCMPENVDEGIIRHSVQIKNEVVCKDPREKGLRKVLNFGHTLGHAIESYFLNHEHLPALLHGEAIAAGMVLEAYLSIADTNLSEEDCDEIKSVFNSLFPRIAFTADQVNAIKKLLIHDKKNTHGRVRFTLLETIGQAVYDREIPEDQIDRAFDYYKQ